MGLPTLPVGATSSTIEHGMVKSLVFLARVNRQEGFNDKAVRVSDIHCVAYAVFESLSKRSRQMSRGIQIRRYSKGKRFVRGASKYEG